MGRLLVQLKVVEPERTELGIVVNAPLANVDCLFKLVLSFLELRSLKEYVSVVRVLLNKVLEGVTSFGFVSTPPKGESNLN